MSAAVSLALLSGLAVSAKAEFTAGLDGASNSSTFETSAIAALPQAGWTDVNGTARIFDAAAANGSIIGTGAFDLFTVQYTPAQSVALLPETRYILHFDMGFVAGNAGGTADYSFQLGTVTGGVFTGLGEAAAGTIAHAGNLYSGTVSGSAEQIFVTGATVPAGSLAVQWSVTAYSGQTDFFGFDNVTLRTGPAVEVPDTTPPQLLSAGSLNGATIGLAFNEALDAASAGNPASYTVPAGVSVVSAELLADGKTVLLTVTGLNGTTFSVAPGGVKDAAGNAAPATQMTGTVLTQNVADVGLPVEPGSAYSTAEGGLTLHAGGYDVWFNADSFLFAPVEKTGDFDVRVQVTDFSPAATANPNAKALLMVREGPEAESRHVSVTVYPRDRNWTAFRREINSGASSVLGGNWRISWPEGVNFPNAWLRLRRSGETFTTYGSPDGEVWTQVGDSWTPEEAFPATVLVGMGATSFGDQAVGAPMVDATFQNFGNFGLPGSVITFVQQPVSLSVLENTKATFLAGVTVTGTAVENVDYQWLRDGVAIPGANAATYTTGDLARTDSGAKFQLRASVSGGDSKLSDEVILTVIPDTAPPVIVSAISLGGASILIRFDEVLDPVSAVDSSHYTLAGGGVVHEAQLQEDAQSVLLLVSALSGSAFQGTINGVSDLALNVLNTALSGQILPWISEDIGLVDPPSSASATGADAFDVKTAGADIWLTQDSFHFVHQDRTGDFDVRVQMARLDPVNGSTRGGLMVREDLGAGSRNFFVGTYPAAGDNHWVSTARQETDGDTTLAPGDSYVIREAGFAYPNVWFRLMRAGNTFTAFYGTNGSDWTRIGDQFTPEIPYPDTVSLGLATASINAAAQTVAHYRNFGNTVTETAELAITRNGDGILLSWPESAAGFTLHTTADLIAGPWTAVTTAPVLTAGRYQVMLPVTMARQFFRLQK
ncbi:MAG: hypothetical protein JWM59_2191 [Verrucomicrobiales bacterium]|nr:hypothetical protein [Verrucomicrobiales bacterium]